MNFAPRTDGVADLATEPYAAAMLTIGTWVLAIGALLTAFFAFRAYRTQTPVLALQREELEASLAERKREAEARELAAEAQRRAQASQVFMTEQRNRPNPHPRGTGTTGFAAAAEAQERIARGQSAIPSVSKGTIVRVENTSDQPVYDVKLIWHVNGERVDAGDNPEELGTLGPHTDSGDQYREVPEDANPDLFGATLVFRDAADVTWRRGPDGRLNEYLAAQKAPGAG